MVRKSFTLNIPRANTVAFSLFGTYALCCKIPYIKLESGHVSMKEQYLWVGKLVLGAIQISEHISSS